MSSGEDPHTPDLMWILLFLRNPSKENYCIEVSVCGFTHVHVFFGGWCASLVAVAGWPRHRTCPPSHHPPGGNGNGNCWERLVCWEGSAASDTEQWSAVWIWEGSKKEEERRFGENKKRKWLLYLHKTIQADTKINYKWDCKGCCLRLCPWDRSYFQWLPRMRSR